MPKSTAHFDEPLQDWTRRKHAILEEYLPTFCTALVSTARHAILSGTIAPGQTLVIPSQAGGPIWNNTSTDPAALYPAMVFRSGIAASKAHGHMGTGLPRWPLRIRISAHCVGRQLALP
jgi:hypothetical protein